MGKGVFGNRSSRETGVVVRATVESFGPVGDTELTVNVKWPAGSAGVQRIGAVKQSSPGGEPAKPSSDGGLEGVIKRRPPAQP
jgi:hypothetical protein